MNADEVEKLRETNRRLNRRCQEAEAALPDWKEILKCANQGGGLRGGSLGRRLLAWGLTRAQEENDRLKARLTENEVDRT